MKTRGGDLPSGGKYSYYIDEKLTMKILHFFQNHCKTFPLLFILVQNNLSIVSNEAGDERVFNNSLINTYPMMSNIIPNTYQNIVKDMVNVNIFCILDKHVF